MSFRGVGIGVSAALVCLFASIAAFAQVPRSKHVVLVIDENTSFHDVMGNMPWLVGQGHANGYATNYKSDNGGSLMDYLWLASGSCHSKVNCTLPPGTHDFNCSGNDCYYPGTNKANPITDDNIFRELNNAGISWKVYAQSYARAGGTVTTPDGANGTSYYRRHNGATWYSDVLNNDRGSASKIVDLSQLAVDLSNGKLPGFAIIVPDGNHDAHDCPVGMQHCSLAEKLEATDDFLNTTLTPILGTPSFQPGGDGLIAVTFDECGGGTNDGCGAAVYAALIGPKVKPHTVSNVDYKHESMLRTMLEALGVKTYPGAAAHVSAMSDFFNQAADRPEVSIQSPADGARMSSPLTVRASAAAPAGRAISGWYVYLDGSPAYHTGSAASISANLRMSAGKHSILVRAWDTSGKFGDQSVSVTAISSTPKVTVSTPNDKANLGSPANIQATASPTAGHAISGWWIYVDGAHAYDTGAKNTIAANVKVGLGAHSVLVRAWDTSGAYGDQNLTLTVSKKPALQVYVPAAGANVTSSISVQATATAGEGFRVSGWYVYLDGKPVYHAGAVTSINTKVSASAGQHTILVRTWDTSGAYADRSLPVRVQPVAVNVSTPANGASVDSPVNIQATAGSAHSITGWRVYVDSADAFAQDGGTSMNANLRIGSGTHTIKVRAWDNTGKFGDQDIEVTVP